MDLLEKIARNAVPLSDLAGVRPYRGVLTGLNDAFLINTQTRGRLVEEDPNCSDIIKPYLRGQDIERWWLPNSGLFMIVLKSSGDHAWPWTNAADEIQAERSFAASYPSVHRYMKKFGTGRTRDRQEHWVASSPGSWAFLVGATCMRLL